MPSTNKLSLTMYVNVDCATLNIKAIRAGTLADGLALS
jgi:hypothetical protein